jgi:lysophospholipase
MTRMANSKKLRTAAGAAEEQLKAGAKLVQAQLATAAGAAAEVASKAKERLPAAAGAAAEVAAKAKERLPAASEVASKAKGVVAKRGGRGRAPRPVMAPSAASRTPDDSWTVADLREEAKRRGATGYSRMTKAELLKELGG